MEITLNRKYFTETSTIGELNVDGEHECYMLEDQDRKIETTGIKVATRTCIPRGRYRVTVTMSNRFKRPLPLLNDVPYFDGIRIHPGNSAVDTDGCLLPGLTYTNDYVTGSVAAFGPLFTKINDCVNAGGEVWITIT